MINFSFANFLKDALSHTEMVCLLMQYCHLVCTQFPIITPCKLLKSWVIIRHLSPHCSVYYVSKLSTDKQNWFVDAKFEPTKTEKGNWQRL